MSKTEIIDTNDFNSFIVESCHEAAVYASYSRRQKVKVDDFRFVLRHDPLKFGRVQELLAMDKILKDGRKAFNEKDDQIDHAAAATAAAAAAAVVGGDGDGGGDGVDIDVDDDDGGDEGHRPRLHRPALSLPPTSEVGAIQPLIGGGNASFNSVGGGDASFNSVGGGNTSFNSIGSGGGGSRSGGGSGSSGGGISVGPGGMLQLDGVNDSDFSLINGGFTTSITSTTTTTTTTAMATTSFGFIDTTDLGTSFGRRGSCGNDGGGGSAEGRTTQ